MKPVTWEEKIEARGLERGWELGKDEGMRELLVHLLNARFSNLPAQTIKRIKEIKSAEDLISLARGLLTANSLEELGLAPDSGRNPDIFGLVARRPAPRPGARYRKPPVEGEPETWEEKIEERGRVKGMRELLLRQLFDRFPNPTARAIERIESLRSRAELGSLGERLLTARSIVEIEGALVP